MAILTIAFYGPNDKHASKISVGIIHGEGEEPSQLERWCTDMTDARNDGEIAEAVVRFIEQHGAKSVVATDKIIGCPHEEGIDYPEGQPCPKCPFGAYRNRWSGEVIQ